MCVGVCLDCVCVCVGSLDSVCVVSGPCGGGRVSGLCVCGGDLMEDTGVCVCVLWILCVCEGVCVCV